jgi:hypothetical protein
MRELVLALAAVFFAGMGLYALAAPAALAGPFALTVTLPQARSEIRAVYGGFGLAVAGVLCWSAFGDDGLRNGAALTVGVALAGMAAGRVISRLVDTRQRRSIRFGSPVWSRLSVPRSYSVSCERVRE